MGRNQSLKIFTAATCLMLMKGTGMAGGEGDTAYEARKLEIDALRAEAAGDISVLITRTRARETDADEELMRDLIAEVWRVGNESVEPSDRSATIGYLLNQAQSQTGYLHEFSLRLLLSFKQDDFNDSDRSVLTGLASVRLSPGLSRVIGVAQATDAVPTLAVVAAQPFAERSTALKADLPWVASLALARMGDTERLDAILERIQAEEDVVVRSSILFADLGYTKTPRAFGVLRRFLSSASHLPALKSSQDKGDPEALYAARVIAKHTSGGPDPEVIHGTQLISAMKEWSSGLEVWPIVQ